MWDEVVLPGELVAKTKQVRITFALLLKQAWNVKEAPAKRT